MNEKPILFSPEMAGLTAAGKKTQTRRTVRAQYVETKLRPFKILRDAFVDSVDNVILYRYGGVGDRLWVQESFRLDQITYRADGATRKRKRYIHGMYMPKMASRTTLEIIKVRIQHLREITEEDAVCEGTSGRAAFFALWDMLHGTHVSSNTNPLVEVYDFRKVIR